MEHEPAFQHLPLRENEIRFLTTRILKVLDHGAIVALSAHAHTNWLGHDRE